MKKSLKEIHAGRRDVPLLIGVALSVFVGIIELAKGGDWLLALILFFFSMVFPFIKLLSLATLWCRKMSDVERMKTLHWLGKWSMLTTMRVEQLAKRSRPA